ncbi:MAG: Rab family GTPase [Candidatus Hodarchaeota archaeon]
MNLSESKNTSDPKEMIKIKLVLLGDGAVGKTTLKNRYLGKGFEERYLPTLGADISIKTINIRDESLKCRIWDLAGQPKFHTVRKLYYRGAIGAILMYDITLAPTLDNLENWLKELEKHNHFKEIPLIIVGNKIDLRQTTESCVSTEKGREFTESLKNQLEKERFVHFLETSAKENQNVNDAFEKLGEGILKYIKSRFS